MKFSTKAVVVIGAVGVMAGSAIGAPVLEDVTAKFNAGIRYTLNG